MDYMLDAKETAEYLRVSIPTIRRWLSNGVLKATRYVDGGKLWFYRADLDALRRSRYLAPLTDEELDEKFEPSEETQLQFLAQVEKLKKG